MSGNGWTRRQILAQSLPAFLGSAGIARLALSSQDDESFPPVRKITSGPRHHWFGYYDKLQFDPASRFVLGMQVDFEHRSPRANDTIKIGMVDLKNGDRWIDLGESTAWCWQQGCMLQWRPGSATEVLWNDRQDGRFVCHILNVETKRRRTIPHAIYSVSPDGRSAVTLDFRRVNDVRPGYGYAGLRDPFADQWHQPTRGCFPSTSIRANRN